MARKKRSGGGGLSRRAALALVGGGGLLAVSGTGAFDTVEGDRGFDVSTTADQSEAVLGIVGLSDRFSALVPSDGNFSDSYQLLTLVNNESQTFSQINIETDSNILDIGTPDKIPSNDEREVTGQINLSDYSGENVGYSENRTVTLEITVSTSDSGSGITVETTREVEVAGYRVGECPSSSATPVTEVASEYNSSGDLIIDEGPVLSSVRASGTVEVDPNANKRLLIDGSIEAQGEGESKIQANGKQERLYISGDIDVAADDGDLLIKGKKITIAGDVNVEGTLEIFASGNPSEIIICGEAEPDRIRLAGDNATVEIDGEEKSSEGDGDDDDEGDGDDDDEGDGDDDDEGDGDDDDEGGDDDDDEGGDDDDDNNGNDD